MKKRRIKPTIRKKATSVLNTDTNKMSNDYTDFDLKDYSSLISDNITLFLETEYPLLESKKKSILIPQPSITNSVSRELEFKQNQTPIPQPSIINKKPESKEKPKTIPSPYPAIAENKNLKKLMVSFPTNSIKDLEKVIQTDINTNDDTKQIVKKINLLKQKYAVCELDKKKIKNAYETLKKRNKKEQLENIKQKITIIHLQKKLETTLEKCAEKMMKKNKERDEIMSLQETKSRLLEDKLEECKTLIKHERENQDMIVNTKLKIGATNIVNLAKTTQALKEKMAKIDMESTDDISKKALLQYTMDLREENTKLKNKTDIKFVESLKKSLTFYKDKFQKILSVNKQLQHKLQKKDELIEKMTKKSKDLINEHKKSVAIQNTLLNKVNKTQLQN